MSYLVFKQNGTVHLSDTVRRALDNTSGSPKLMAATAYERLASYVGEPYMVYRFNMGNRYPRPVGGFIPMAARAKLPGAEDRTQHQALLAHCRALAIQVKREQRQQRQQSGQGQQGNGGSPSDPGQQQGEPMGASDPQGEPQGEPTPDPDPLTIDPEPTPEPQGGTIGSDPCPYEEYDKWVAHLREFVKGRTGLASLESMRVTIDGYKLIAQGVPVGFIVDALTAEWGEDSRLQAGVSEFDTIAWGEQQGNVGEFDHGIFPMVEKLIAANVPVWVYGGAGTGKSMGAEKAAEQLGFAYYEVNLSGQTASALTGKYNLHDFVTSDYMRAYQNGGICTLEEGDNAHPQVLTVLNNSIAGDHFSNPVTGERVERHPDFRIVVTANTTGNGAADGYKRNSLDAATIDRFRPGRVRQNRDARLERNILNKIKADATA